MTSPLILTVFDYPHVWGNLKKLLETPSPEGFKPYFEYIEDKKYEGLTVETIDQFISILPEVDFIYIPDKLTFTQEPNRLLCIDISNESYSSFRFLPQNAWMVENNLSIGNMGFEEFMEEEI